MGYQIQSSEKLDLSSAIYQKSIFATGKRIDFINSSSLSAHIFVDLIFRDGKQESGLEFIEGGSFFSEKEIVKMVINSPAQSGEFIEYRFSELSGSEYEYNRGDNSNIDKIGKITEAVKTSGSSADIEHGKVTISDSEGVIFESSQFKTRRSFRNVGSSTVYVGGSGVTVNDGFPVHSGESFNWDSGALLKGISESSTELRILEN